MKPNILDFIDRWRHTYGYGVHSPLAYTIITECIHPERRYAYYADALIQSHSENAEMHQQFRLIIRLVNTLHLKNIWMPDCPQKMGKILARAFPKVKLSVKPKCPENPDFIVIFSGSYAKIKSQLPSSDQDFTILHFHPEGRPKMSNLMSNLIPTLTLESKYFTLLLRREGMQPVKYSLL